MLTPEQKDIIENSIWVVNTALKKQGLTYNEDLRQSAILYMCKCLERFDPTKNIKWTTYAYENVYLYIKRKNRKENLRQSFEVSQDFVCDIKPKPLECNDSALIVDNIFKICTPKEKQILQLKLEGYNYAEISLKMGCCISKVNFYMKGIKEKAKELQYEK